MRAFSQFFLEGTRKRLVQAAGVTGFVALMVVPALAQDCLPPPDRLVAEWMVRMGGSVVLRDSIVRSPTLPICHPPIFMYKLWTSPESPNGLPRWKMSCGAYHRSST